ncbi:MAG TPA: SHOCT domain-containing protein [Acidimicrobiales bacterium]|nr:SHOCT domain-containing protein [Acidimicrobiales bacterium]
MMWWGPGGGWGWGDWLAMALMMLAFWGLIAAVVFAVIRSAGHSPGPTHANGPPPPGPGGDQARRILDERFARGDIDAEEYRSRRELLRSP